MNVRIWFWKSLHVRKGVIVAFDKLQKNYIRKENRNGSRNITDAIDEEELPVTMFMGGAFSFWRF